MQKAPLDKMTKGEILKLAKTRCEHGHTYLEHYGCYLKEHEGITEPRIGFIDIESSNLAADFGIMFCYCIKKQGSSEILERVVTDKEVHENLDKVVVEQCIKDMQQFDQLVTYYGTGFDLPFIRTRALYHNLPFPEFGTIQHKDVFYIIKSKFRLSRSRMENACRTLVGKTEKNHINGVYWLKALQGDAESLEYIADHCRRDVRDLEKLYNKVIKFVKPTTKPI